MLIGQRIRGLREQKDLSQGDIERQTGMLRGYISRVEHGHTTPSVETLHRFAAALDVPMYQLFFTAGDEALPAAVGGRPESTLEQQAQSTGTEGSEARFLLQIRGLLANMAESDRTLLLDFARRLATRSGDL
jgi:transcriptional regulator with XRE-family HTH domain